MLHTVEIKNYKSIENLSIELGRVNVFIGENGAGKSNILEALALAAAAEANKLDNEFLASRGIRVTSPELMRSAFKKQRTNDPIRILIGLADGASFDYKITNDNKPYSTWENHTNITPGGSKAVMSDIAKWLTDYMKSIPDADAQRAFSDALISQLEIARGALEKSDSKPKSKRRTSLVNIEMPGDAPPPFKARSNHLDEFVIFSPENSALRIFEREGQLEPLGVNGEGLLKFLYVLQNDFKSSFEEIKESLKMLSWFDDLSVVQESGPAKLQISDLYIDQQLRSFDQRSANEGFLFVAFYFALFTSELTPRVFSIDNIDASLNPKLCMEMSRRLAQLAKKNDKQTLLTTHNPAVLDGLDLRDDEQRLFIVRRDRRGTTQVSRFEKHLPENLPTRMSELFLRGTIGGLPKNF